MRRTTTLGIVALWLACMLPVAACDLCAVYSADNTRDQRETGWLLTLSESFIPYETLLLDGQEISGDSDFRDTSITHIVPGYNFSRRFGLSLNVPVVYHDFRRKEVRYSRTGPPAFQTESGSILGVGDLSWIARWTVFERAAMKRAFAINVLGGVKFPTGNADRIADEVNQAKIYDSFLPPGTKHDPLGHAVSGVHQHDLAEGSGSFDGVFGLAMRSRWRRWFWNAQFQYYLRTEGEATFRYGDDLSITGGPGGYALLSKDYTLSLQANASYDSMARDELLGRISNRTGMTGWYLGPQLTLTVSDRFSLVAGVDVPLHFTNNGLQNVPDYRFHANLVWRF